MNLTLGKRIASGIALMLMLMMAVGYVGYYGLNQVLKGGALANRVGDLRDAVLTAGADVDRYLLSVFNGDRELHDASVEGVARQLAAGLKLVQAMKEESVFGQAEIAKLDAAAKDMTAYGALFAQYRGVDDDKAKLEATVNKDFGLIMENIAKGVIRTEALTVSANVLRASITNYLKTPGAANWKKVEADLGNMQKSLNDWHEFVSSSEQLDQLGKEIKKEYEEVKASVTRHNTLTISQRTMKETMEGYEKNLTAICAAFVELGTITMQEETRNALRLIIGFIGLALLIGVVYATISIKGIIRRLNAVITGVTEGSEQVANAAGQVASAGQVLAEGSSEQAASLEETSSSFEEMSSLTKQNAQRAGEAKSLMRDVQAIVEKVNDHMNKMTEAISEITKSSEETGKIIRTINEIAFQTNLLALNAAVEAARAGEAGAGFAVVADEVRNLARRAAEASENTAYLIENTVRNVRTGNELTMTTKEAFTENINITAKVGQLVDEISEASNEQAIGIEQANRAMAEMNSVTQRNAASAEESASSAEQMMAQAEQMKGYVQQLAALVGRSRNGQGEAVPAKEAKGGVTGRLKGLVPGRAGKTEPESQKLLSHDDDF